MTRVVSLFLPQLAIERLRRVERPLALPERPGVPSLPVDDDPGACSVPRGGHWRPGARWSREQVAREAASLPLHQQPPGRELGRRSEAARHPFSGGGDEKAVQGVTTVPDATAPLVLVAAEGQRQVVTAACPAARALGLWPGMPATQARALVADLAVRLAERAADLRWLERLALHAVRHWTSVASLSGSDGLWLDVTGGAHLFGGEERFCRRLRRYCARLGFTARIAVAGTTGAAHALARFGRDEIAIVPAGRETQAIADLPLAALRLEPEALNAAARFGLERVADLLPMPRGPMARRLTLSTVTRLDQAIGRVAEPITGIVPFEAPTAERRLLEPIGTAEQILQVIGDTMADLIVRLQERGLGARSIDLTMPRVDGADQRLTVGTSRATRDARHLMRLFALRIDRIDPGLGLEGARLIATRAEPLAAAALGPALAGGPERQDIATVVDRLAGRVGGAALFKAAPVESDVPERAVRRAGPLSPSDRWPCWRRPARLLARPEPLTSVVALLPDAPPRRFTWRGDRHDVVAGDGPERILGEWWRRDGELDAVRVYYQVEDETGARYWLFRRGDGEDARTGDLTWYMHGLFG